MARALVSIIALLPQEDENDDDEDEERQQDLNYYLSRNDVDEEQYNPINPSAISHACCALANFATNCKLHFFFPSLLDFLISILFKDYLLT